MSSFLIVLAQAHFLFLVSAIFFIYVLRKIFDHDARLILKGAQYLFLACLLLPVTLSLLPQVPVSGVLQEKIVGERQSGTGKPNVRKPFAPPQSESLIAPRKTAVSIWSLLRVTLPNNYWFWIFSLWLASFFATGISKLRSIIQTRRLIRNSSEIRCIGRVSIVVSDEITVPFSFRLWRAYVVLPTKVVLHTADYKIALAHELHHHRSGDTLWALLIEFCICIFQVNPAIYIWKKILIELQELSCDETLIGQMGVSAKDYGRCLLRVAEAALNHETMRVGTTCMAVGLGSRSREKPNHHSFLRRRISMFSSYGARRAKSRGAYIMGTIGILALSALAVYSQAATNDLRSFILSQPNPGKAEFDPAIQAITTEVLQKAVSEYGAKGGFVLVSDPKTGKLLAAAAVDAHMSETLSGNWPLSLLVDPASTIKSLTVATALDEKVTRVDDIHNCENGHYDFNGIEYKDHSDFDHLSTAETVIQSSNICGIKIGQLLGSDRLEKMMKDLGFGEGGVTRDFPEARAGIVPSTRELPENKYIPLLAIGSNRYSGFQVTPLEMVQAYGAIANGGKLMKPMTATEPDTNAKVLRRVMSEYTARQMRAVLERVIREGTAKGRGSKLYGLGGKTGTSYSTESTPKIFTSKRVGSLIGFAPAGQPRVVIYAAVFGPDNAEGFIGARYAGPIFRDVADRVLQHLNVPTEN